jgi:hypothetical protein
MKDTILALGALTIELILVLGTSKSHIQTNSGAQPSPLLMDTGNFFFRDKMGRAKTHHSLSSTAEIQNARSYTFMLPLCLRQCDNS